MGNALADIRGAIDEQIDRIENETERTYLHLGELKRLEIPENVFLNIFHIGTLYKIDSEKSGRFTRKDIHTFIEFCSQYSLPTFSTAEFQSTIRARCSLVMAADLSGERAAEEFASWVEKMLTTVQQHERANDEPDGTKGGIHASKPGTSTQLMFSSSLSLPNRSANSLDMYGSGQLSGTQSQESSIVVDSLDSLGQVPANTVIRAGPIRLLHELLQIGPLYRISFVEFWSLLLEAQSDEYPSIRMMQFRGILVLPMLRDFVSQFYQNYYGFMERCGLQDNIIGNSTKVSSDGLNNTNMTTSTTGPGDSVLRNSIMETVPEAADHLFTEGHEDDDREAIEG
eukprot:Clim_evm28s211 gene=Clim_evmTU28s211